MPTSRQNLASVLTFLVRERKFSLPYIASRCGSVTVTEVQRWLDGVLVPNSGEWANLQRYISKDLFRHDALWQAARKEEAEERRITVRALDRAKMESTKKPETPKVATNLGDKLREAAPTKAVAKPTPTMVQLGQAPKGFAKDGRLLCPTRPAGSMTEESKQARRQFVKAQLLLRPKMPFNGPDGLRAILLNRFGIGLDPRILKELRNEIAQEHQHNVGAVKQTPETVTSNQPSTICENVPKPSTAVTTTPTHNPKDMQAGVELILGAVPGLQKLTITVDDKGEASVDFDIRKVEIRTTSGSLKINCKN